MKLKLRIETKGKDAEVLELDGKDSYSLGRTNADIVIDESACSRVHALIFTDSKGCKLRDLGSRNGTSLDGKKVELDALQIGSVIKIGGTKIFVVEVMLEGAVENPKQSGPASSVLLGWPHAFRAIQKEKIEPYVDFIDEKARKKSVRLQEIELKKKKKKIG